MPLLRLILLAGVLALPAVATLEAQPRTSGVGSVAGTGVIRAVRVEGAQRIEEATIRSYMLAQPGDPFEADRMDRTLRTLFATGLFSDVSLRREGDTLVVAVVENPIINRIAFEGNSALGDETLRAELQMRPRAVFTRSAAQADRQRLLDVYARRGKFGAVIEPKIIELDQNRVDLVFEINEGPVTRVGGITFIGNEQFSDSTLRGVIQTRESAWYRFLTSDDTYDPDRVNFDQELLRRFYLARGFAEFTVVSAIAEVE